MSDTPVIDGHVDTLLAARNGTTESFDEAGGRHVSLDRLRAGGVAAAFFAAFVPAAETDPVGDGPRVHPPRADPDRVRRETNAMLDLLDRWIDAGRLRRITEPADLDRVLADARAGSDADDESASWTPGAIAHLEGAEAVAPDLSNLERLYDRGVRSIGPVWSRPNAFGHGVPFAHDETPDTGPGLTDAGERLVRACEESGVVVDCAHLTAAGLRDVARISSDPLVVSHAGIHGVSPAARNLTDSLLELVAAEDGLVGISFAAAHVRPDGATDANTPLATVLDHVDHAVRVAGLDHVAIGTDFDGATVVESVSDPTGFDRVRAGLRDRGYGDEAIDRITHGNWARVLRETL